MYCPLAVPDVLSTAGPVELEGVWPKLTLQSCWSAVPLMSCTKPLVTAALQSTLHPPPHSVKLSKFSVRIVCAVIPEAQVKNKAIVAAKVRFDMLLVYLCTDENARRNDPEPNKVVGRQVQVLITFFM